ncbi:histidine kinase [Actinoplanes sp. SE50]|uniref:sensor histidine kinase n=1 Tax=unclassified Actinoplanes TaxID=2626549 RepID=UPI00023ECFA9|nr:MULTISPECIES: sensor histidine kinase [unclassified Actinoplanes]AEV81597.1 multi-sensor signal transduction histidine kinase [Actinoplanes sp. SE50/110]ATO79998.1 histidine kinase [Actinoplanes sp. SE50]SLL97402.1 histidine kinase [Actinoplanes sp. SE50/110]
MNVRTWSLRGRIVALCAVVGLILTALGIFAATTAATHNRQLDDVLNRVSPMRAASETLGTALVDQETGIRGFAITGRDASLEPYRQGLVEQNTQVSRIDGFLRPDDGQIRADLAAVRARIDDWHRDVAEPVIATVRDQGAAAGQAKVEAGDTRQFDAVRDALSVMQTHIQTLRAHSAAAAKESSHTMVAIEIAAAAIVVLAGIFLLLLLDRLISRPILELAGQVRDVAAGDYERHIESSVGAPELVGLAADIDRMRQQIATELTEVRDARQQVEWVNQQLQSQAEELTRSNRDLEQFAYVASHDLQEPLRKVASFCQLLQRRYAGKLDDRADQYIGFAVDGAQRMQRLINDLLAFSRIGRLTSGFTDVDLDRVLGDVKSQLDARAGEDGEITWGRMPTVEGEEPLLTTLFVNLIGNSLKFRRPDVAPRVRVTAERDGSEWKFNVRDNGIGIEAEFADKVFVIFQRLHARDAYEGTGIGLAIVKKIVEYHGGRIWLDVDVSPGASIWFTLPALIGLDEPGEEHEEREAVGV